MKTKTKVMKGVLIGLVVAGIGVTGVCMVHAKHTAEAKQEELLLCKEETKWYYRTKNGVLQKRQWSLTYGKWMSEWTDVSGTEIPGNVTVETPSYETDNILEKKDGLLAKSDNEIREEAYRVFGLNPAEWFGKFLTKSSEEAVLLLYPPRVKVTQTDSYADIVANTNAVLFVYVSLGGAENLRFSAIKEYGVGQAGVYEMGTDTYIGIVYKDRNDMVGLEAYGMAWYRYDEAGVCQRVCSAAEKIGLYTYWKDRKPILHTDGSITLYNGTGEDTTVNATVFLSGTVPYLTEYGVSGPELIRKVMQEDEEREDLYFTVGYEGAEVTDYVTNGDTVHFVIEKYSTSHQTGFESVLIGAMDMSGEILQCELYGADRGQTIFLQTVEENYDQYGADYLVLSTETEYQGVISSAKQVFRTDETGFVRTWIARENGQEYVIDYDVDQIPIAEEYFSDKAFREYIKEKIDTNGDGFLTKKEREPVRSIDFDASYYRWLLKDEYTEIKTVLDGLNWFPNLERLELMSEAEVYLCEHPGITVVNWKESSSSLLFADGCEKLETIAIHMSSGGAVYANNCESLKRISSYDGKLGAVYTSETPNLDGALTEEDILKEVYELIEQKNYPMAMSILLKNHSTPQTKKLLEELQYFISGDYILNLGYGSFAAINKEGNVVFRFYDDQRFGDKGKLTTFQNGKSLYETISCDVAVLGWDGSMDTTQIESGHYAGDRLVTWMEQRKNDASLPKIIYLDVEGFSFLAQDEIGGLYFFNHNGDLEEDITKKVQEMTDIVDMAICRNGIVVLHSDGTVEYVGNTDGGSVLSSSMSVFLMKINGWTDIIDIDSDGSIVAGLRADGTVVVSDNWEGEGSFHDVKKWTDIIVISVGFQSIMGIKRDGTVVYSGHVTEAQKTASEWNDIVAVSASFQSCLGLKADGTLVIAGEDPDGQTIPELSEFKDLYIPTIENQEDE